MIMSFVTHQWFLALKSNQRPLRSADTKTSDYIWIYSFLKDGAQQFVARVPKMLETAESLSENSFTSHHLMIREQWPKSSDDKNGTRALEITMP